jgi:tetratricopeptide (TPR) repeat protein
MRRGDYPAALARMDSASKAYERIAGPTSPLFIRTELARGECLTRMGKFKTARPHLENALERTSAKDEPAYASAQAGLGLLELELGKPERATELLQSALELRKKNYGEKHVLVAQCLSGLGRAQAAGGDVEKGVKSLEQAVQIRETAGSADTWQKGQDYLSLAQLYEKAAKPAQALLAYRSSVEIFRRSYSPEYPEAIQQAIEGLAREKSGTAQTQR